jgi:hypothetical protein
MYWLPLVLAVVGFAALFYGFSKNNRKILLSAGIVLFLAGSLGDFLAGFEEGVMSQAPAKSESSL